MRQVLVPKESAKLTLVLSGIRCPRTARNAGEKSEPYGVEAAVYASRKLFQRDVEIIISDVDRSGGFIGKMFINGEDVAVSLCREGLAKTDEYSATKELTDAENEAKRAKKNVSSAHSSFPSRSLITLSSDLVRLRRRRRSHCQRNEAGRSGRRSKGIRRLCDFRRSRWSSPRRDRDAVLLRGAASPQRWCVRSCVSVFNLTVFHPTGIPELETLMLDLTVHHADPKNDVAGFVPRTNDIVSAKFSADDTWYRGRIRRCNPTRKEAEVLYMDYGNSEIVPFSRIRSLPDHFKSLDGQAKEAALSFVLLLGSETEYGVEALERFKDLCEVSISFSSSTRH